MQFAMIDLNEQRRALIDIQEYLWLTQTPLPTFDEGETPEEDGPLYLVYGAYLAQPAETPESIQAELAEVQESWLRTLRPGAWDRIGLMDAMFLPLVAVGQTLRAPMAAVIQVPDRVLVNLKKRRTQAVVASRLYSNLGPLDTVLNRRGIFAFDRLEQRPGRATPTLDTWREGLDLERIQRACQHIR